MLSAPADATHTLDMLAVRCEFLRWYQAGSTPGKSFLGRTRMFFSSTHIGFRGSDGEVYTELPIRNRQVAGSTPASTHGGVAQR